MKDFLWRILIGIAVIICVLIAVILGMFVITYVVIPYAAWIFGPLGILIGIAILFRIGDAHIETKQRNKERKS